jgi:hypothetical protein
MKILIIISIVFTFNIHSAKTQNQLDSKEKFSDSITLKAKNLKRLYLLSTSSSGANEIYKQKFFYEFPNTFGELDEIYGYNKNKPAPLYREAQTHIIGLFNNLNEIINDTVYYKKIVAIAIGGHWDGDAINYFQNGLIQKVDSNPKLIAHLLKNMPDKKIKSFWFFYFDGPHPKKQIAAPLQKIKQVSKKIYDLMIEVQGEV